MFFPSQQFNWKWHKLTFRSIWYLGLTTKSYANAKERRAFMMCATSRIPNSHLHTFKVFNLGRVSKTPERKLKFLNGKGGNQSCHFGGNKKAREAICKTWMKNAVSVQPRISVFRPIGKGQSAKPLQKSSFNIQYKSNILGKEILEQLDFQAKFEMKIHNRYIFSLPMPLVVCSCAYSDLLF